MQRILQKLSEYRYTIIVLKIFLAFFIVVSLLIGLLVGGLLIYGYFLEQNFDVVLQEVYELPVPQGTQKLYEAKQDADYYGSGGYTHLRIFVVVQSGQSAEELQQYYEQQYVTRVIQPLNAEEKFIAPKVWTMGEAYEEADAAYETDPTFQQLMQESGISFKEDSYVICFNYSNFVPGF